MGWPFVNTAREPPEGAAGAGLAHSFGRSRLVAPTPFY